jgi:hypothetical protein
MLCRGVEKDVGKGRGADFVDKFVCADVALHLSDTLI